ncbi:MAG: hypothetical protein IJW22_04455 [Clostridia bacterium]|nr:hypothetical protein [Clostridia bacterium]
MKDYSFDLTLALIIHSNEPIEHIKAYLDIDLEQRANHGIEEFPKVSQNLYFCKTKYEECSNTDFAINDFLQKLFISPKKINLLKKIGDCTLRLFVQSDYAQIGFKLSKKSLALLSSLSLPLEISILSWGEVDSN